MPNIDWLQFGLFGSGSAMSAVRSALVRVAPTHATVMITGETGTGKELVARAIHELSPRRARPWIAVNCVAMAPTLITAELFGHERGAFTGADRRRIGRFEAAHHGTLFLDEIGEMPPDSQAVLLRAIQERVVERVGGESVAVDVRIVAATNRDPIAEVAAGRFRSDLFHRLNVFPITLPPLRDRRDDIPELARHFVEQLAAEHHRAPLRLRDATMRLLQSYDWPGNVRELRNLLERAIIVSEGEELFVDPSWICGGSVSESAKTWAEQEQRRIRDALSAAGGRVYGPGGAAQRLGLNPTTLYSKMRKHGIQRTDGQS